MFAFLERSANLFSGNEDGLFVLVEFHQVDAADGFVIGGKSNVERVNLQVAVEFVENLLSVEVAPNRRAVVVGGVCMLAADNQVGKPKVLTVNGVHDSFFRSAVEHLDIQPEKDDSVRNRFARSVCPQLSVRVAFAQSAIGNELFVGLHADFSVDVVALGFSDERVEARAGVKSLLEQRFQTVNQSVFVSAMERVASLESDNAFPAFGFQQIANFRRGENVLAERRVLFGRKNLNLAADKPRLRAVVDENHFRAGMIGAAGQIDFFNVVDFVPREDVSQFQNSDDFVSRVDQRDFLPHFEGFRQFFRNGQRQRNRPGVRLAVRENVFFVENAVVGFLVHRTGQRGQTAVAEPVNGRKVRVRDGNLNQLSRLSGEIGNLVCGNG